MAGRSRRVLRGLALAGGTALVLGVGLPATAGVAQAQTPGFTATFSPSSGAAGTAIDVLVTGCSASQVQGAPAVTVELGTDSGSRDATTYAFASPSGTTLHYVAPPEYDYEAGAAAGPTYVLRVRCAHTPDGGPGTITAGTFTYVSRAPRPTTTSTSTTRPPTTTTTTLGPTSTTVPSTTTSVPYLSGFEGNGRYRSPSPTDAPTLPGGSTATTAAPGSTTTVARPSAPPAQTVDGLVDDPTPAPGQLVTFGSYGFRPGSRVHVELQSTPVALGDFTVAPDGTVAGRVRIPVGTALGDHLIVISGVDPSGAALVRQLPILVTEGSTRIPTTGGDDGALLLAGLLLLGVGLVASGRAVARATGRP